MGVKERRERERQETRAKILDAAREMFATYGIEATTMRAIASRIEYTPTAIYHHFRDKDALITELCHGDFLSLAKQMNRIGRIDDPVEQLRRIGQAYAEFALENPHHYQIMFMTRTPVPKDVNQIQKNNPEEDAYGFLLQTVAEGIQAGRFRPEFDDPHQLAQLMWSGVHGVVSLHIAKESDPWVEWRDARATAEAMLDITLRGVLRDPVV